MIDWVSIEARKGWNTSSYTITTFQSKASLLKVFLTSICLYLYLYTGICVVRRHVKILHYLDIWLISMPHNIKMQGIRRNTQNCRSSKLKQKCFHYPWFISKKLLYQKWVPRPRCIGHLSRRFLACQKWTRISLGVGCKETMIPKCSRISLAYCRISLWVPSRKRGNRPGGLCWPLPPL